MTTAAPANPLARQLKRVWSQLPAGAMSERELDDAILRILGRYEGDYAHAGAVRAQLTSVRAVKVRPGDRPRELVYERAAEFIEWPYGGPGSEAFNDYLRQQHEETLAGVDRQRAAELEASPWGWQRRAILELIDQRVDERFAALLASLDDDVITRMRARVSRDAAEVAHDDKADADRQKENSDEL